MITHYRMFDVLTFMNIRRVSIKCNPFMYTSRFSNTHALIKACINKMYQLKCTIVLKHGGNLCYKYYVTFDVILLCTQAVSPKHAL